MFIILGRSQKYFIARQTELGKLNGHIEEIYSSLNVVKVYNGESKANDIIKYRDTNGKFNSIEDIKKVTGIGENVFASIKENITTW